MAISGARQRRLPTELAVMKRSDADRAEPKSDIFKRMSAVSSMFSGLRSRCTTFCRGERHKTRHSVRKGGQGCVGHHVRTVCSAEPTPTLSWR